MFSKLAVFLFLFQITCTAPLHLLSFWEKEAVCIGHHGSDLGCPFIVDKQVKNHSCVVLENDTIRCWGRNDYGQLGYGNTETIGDDETPSTVDVVDIGGGTVSQIALGDYHTCVLLASGDVRCWGYNEYGQLGYGNTETIGDNEVPSSVGDVSIGGMAIQIATGANHTCTLLATGVIHCWGDNKYGQLGYGNTETIGDDEVPSSVGVVSVGGNVTQIATGANHTCVLLDTNAVRCWGQGVFGQLGYGNTETIGDDEVPSSVAEDVDVGGNVTQIATGDFHSCALLDTDAVHCWGRNEYGQLGYGKGTVSYGQYGYKNSDNIGDDEVPSSVLEEGVDIEENITQIATGANHTCVLLDTDTVRCWGANIYGQLGYASANAYLLAKDIGNIDIGGGTVTQITTGGNHTCALLDTGAVRCWGSNVIYGELGYGHYYIIGNNETPSTNVDVGSLVKKLWE